MRAAEPAASAEARAGTAAADGRRPCGLDRQGSSERQAPPIARFLRYSLLDTSRGLWYAFLVVGGPKRPQRGRVVMVVLVAASLLFAAVARNEWALIKAEAP